MLNGVRRHWPAAASVLAVLLASVRAHGEPVSSSTLAPYAVEVRDAQLSTHVDPTQRSTRIPRAVLERARARAVDLPDVLDLVAGARVLDLGGPVREKRLTLRGAGSTAAAVVIDGVPISTPFATGIDLGLVPIEGLEELSLVHGGAGAAYGSGALGGALLVRTRPTRERPSSLSLAMGSLETVLLRGAVSAGGLFSAAAYEQSSGAFEYTSRLPGLPDQARWRANNDARRGQLSTHYQRELGPGRLEIAAGGAIRDSGVPGFETQADLDARELRAQGRLRLAFLRDAGRATPGLQFGAHIQGLGIGYEEGAALDPSRTLFWASGVDVSASAPLESAHRWSARIELGLEHSSSTEHDETSRPRGAAVIADEVQLGAVTVFGALRGELYAGQPFALMPRLGLLWSPVWVLELGFSVGRSFRVPSIDELYHPSQVGLSGNPDLVAETAWESELFARLDHRDFQLELAAFARRTSDLVLYLNRNAFEIRPENLGTANLLGLESSARLMQQLGRLRVELGVSGTLLAGALEETGETWPTLAPLGLATEALLSAYGVELGSQLRYASETSANLSGTLATEPYLRWDASLVVHPVEQASLALSVHNLLDRRDLETVNKLPLPGRTLLFAIRVQEELL